MSFNNYKTLLSRTILLALPALGATAHAQTDYSTVEIISHEVRGSVYYLQGAGGKENLGRMGIEILARDEVRTRMREMAPAIALPVLTYSDDITIHLNGEEVMAISVPPAHTDGDSYIYFTASDVLHMGDVFRTTGFPYIDTANGGSPQGTIEALAYGIGLAGPETIIIPGHGEPSTRADVMEFRDMILDVSSRVRPLVERGLSYEQVVAERPTASHDAQWGDPDRFLRAMYMELGGGM